LTGTAPTPAPAPAPAEYRCRRCGRVLGTVDGVALRLGAAWVIGRAKVQCPSCFHVHRYCPPAPAYKQARPC
jgi:DNA-directed RNA polymerase subunit RPC12/RpoP